MDDFVWTSYSTLKMELNEILSMKTVTLLECNRNIDKTCTVLAKSLSFLQGIPIPKGQLRYIQL